MSATGGRMQSWRLLALTAISPLAAFRELVEQPRSLVALLFVIAARLTVPFALHGRVDSRRAVIADLQASGKLDDTTEKELGEKIDQANKLELAEYGARALFGPLLTTLLFTLALWLWGRYLAAKPAFGVLWSLCAHAQLPLAVRALAQAVVISQQGYLFPGQIDGVLPSGLGALPDLHLPLLATSLLPAADFFRIWVAVLLGVGLLAASKMSRWRATLGMSVAYAIFAVVVFVGLPRLGGA